MEILLLASAVGLLVVLLFSGGSNDNLRTENRRLRSENRALRDELDNDDSGSPGCSGCLTTLMAAALLVAAILLALGQSVHAILF